MGTRSTGCLAQVLHVLQAAPQLVALLKRTEASLDSFQGTSSAQVCYEALAHSTWMAQAASLTPRACCVGAWQLPQQWIRKHLCPR